MSRMVARYVITVSAESATDVANVEITVDVSGDAPIVEEVRFSGSGGIDALHHWELNQPWGLNLEAIVAALPKVPAEPQAPLDIAIEPADGARQWRVKCPRCGRKVTARLPSGKLVWHNDKPHGGLPCPGGVLPHAGTGRRKSRENYRIAPPNVLDLLANTYGGSAKALAEGEGVPHHTAKAWAYTARKRLRPRADVANLPLHDDTPEESPKEEPQP